MALTSKDPYNARETARIIALGYRIARREERGKPTAALEREADRIKEQAEAREAARAKARRK
ncbi:hypothetical protein AB0N92_04150 [Streptomyces sp. NPDC093248]|uniref:hypothetical protein n=1 Tax=Streptomyces sp. NPDC093248 TaxID=3155072 RepID=UPI00342BCFAF